MADNKDYTKEEIAKMDGIVQRLKKASADFDAARNQGGAVYTDEEFRAQAAFGDECFDNRTDLLALLEDGLRSRKAPFEKVMRALMGSFPKPKP